MKSITRREFLQTSLAAGLAIAPASFSRAAASNDQIRIAVVGLGGINVPGSVGGRGRQLIGVLRRVPSARIVALCDVDQAILDASVEDFKKRGQTVAAHRDLRRVLEDKAIDAVILATPNHWHGLGTVWACQAGKDVYVEKPFSHNLWEGRQMVAAARRYERVVQVGTQNRSSPVLRQAFEYLHTGELGPVRYAHALVYRPREGLDPVQGTPLPPASLDYNLWSGPAPMAPLTRPHLHYHWHWFWDTGNGEMGNNGVHLIDICRWGLRQDRLPPRAISLGGRFAVRDRAETPNTHIALFDYKPAPLLCEVRNVRSVGSKQGIGQFRGADRGIVINAEGGYLAGDASSIKVFDRQGKPIREFREGSSPIDIEVAHLSSFLAAVRNRNSSSLPAEATEGHISAGCCHMANISYRLGQTTQPEALREGLRGDEGLLDAVDRCREYLRDNSVDLDTDLITLGPWLRMDPEREQFVDTLAEQANQLARRQYREPFVMPSLA